MHKIIHHMGKLIPVIEQETLELTAESILNGIGFTLDARYHSRREQLLHQAEMKYTITNGKIYKVENLKIKHVTNVTYVFEAIPTEDGSIYFNIKYPAMGYSFDSAIRIAVEGVQRQTRVRT